MTERSLLKIIVASMLLVLIMLAAFPFIRALNPPSHLPKSTSEVNIKDIQPGSGELIILEQSQRIETKEFTKFRTGQGFLVLRGSNNQYYLYWVPVWEGEILMPFNGWGQHEGTCKELKFGKTRSNTLTVYCEDPEWPEFLTKQWYWSFDGKNLGEDLPDLTPVRFRIVSGIMHAYWY